MVSFDDMPEYDTSTTTTYCTSGELYEYHYKEEVPEEEREEFEWKKKEEKYALNCFRNNLHNQGVVLKYKKRMKKFKQKMR
jgi:hypothetical protein